MNRNDAEFDKFVETSDGKVALRLKLHDDSYVLLDARYVLTTTTGNYVAVAGDTMTGTLVLSPATGTSAVEIKTDCRLYFDGS